MCVCLQILCAPPCWKGPGAYPPQSYSIPDVCDGQDVHLGPGIFESLPVPGSYSGPYGDNEGAFITATCPGSAALLFRPGLIHIRLLLILDQATAPNGWQNMMAACYVKGALRFTRLQVACMVACSVPVAT